MYALGGWYCRLCQVGEFCFNNTNRTCPDHSSSFGVAKTYSDCYCNAGYKNTTARTEASFCEDCPANSFCTGKGSVQACTANAVAPVQSASYLRCYCSWGWKGVNNSACVGCQSPTFCYGGVEAQCSEGTYSGALSWNRLNCSCIPGRWGPAGGPCILCGAGKYNLIPGCKACSNTSDVDCELCGLGTASSVLGRNSTCDVCGAGKFSSPANQRGAFTCENCGIGAAAPVGSSNCTTCANGYYAALGASACVVCPAGSFAVAPASACTSCPVGSFSVGLASSSCQSCQAGTYSTAFASSNSSTCTACQVGSYSPQKASACMNCPNNSWNLVQMSSICTANVGYYNLDDSLRAYYPFNDGDFLKDVTGLTGNLVASQASPTSQASGPFGNSSYSAYLDASGSITMANTSQYFALPSFTLPNDMSICLWFWISSSATTTYTYLSDFTVNGLLRNIQIFTQNNNYRAGAFFDTSIGSVSLTNEAKKKEVWRHTCLSFSGTSGKLWLDGIQNSFNLSKNRDYTRSMTSNFIGRSNFGNQGVWWGALDDYRIYHKALSPIELDALYSFRGDTTTPMIILACPRPCPGGTYGGCLGDGAQNCTACGAGFYSSGIGQTNPSTCLMCLAGTYSSNSASVNCEACPAGTYNTEISAPASNKCLACLAGKYGTMLGSPSSENCLDCGYGKYNPVQGADDPSDCLACASGTYTGVNGTTNCSECGVGSFAVTEASVCSLCSPGTFAAARASSCGVCPPGLFSTPDSPICLACAPGEYNDRNASANCSLCEAGRYSTGGASGCLTCTYGTYSSGSGFWYCNECDNGRFTGDGSSAVRLIPCFALFSLR